MVPDEIIKRFELGPDPATFDHRRHVELVWAYLHLRPLHEVLGCVADGLAALAARHGHAERYHHTLTWAFVFVVHDRFREEEDFETFCTNNPDVLTRGRALIETYYDGATLDSERARRTFVWPDRISASR